MTDFPSVIRHDCIKNERRDRGKMDEKEEKEREKERERKRGRKKE